jgi:hypothetical protein
MSYLYAFLMIEGKDFQLTSHQLDDGVGAGGAGFGAIGGRAVPTRKK